MPSKRKIQGVQRLRALHLQIHGGARCHGCWGLQGMPLSDAKRHEVEWKLLPPRKVHPDVLRSLKQVSQYAAAPKQSADGAQSGQLLSEPEWNHCLIRGQSVMLSSW